MTDGVTLIRPLDVTGGARNRTIGHRRRRRSTWRANEQLHPQLCSATTIDHRNTASVDTTRVDQVVLGAVSSRQAFAFASTVAEDVTLRTSFALQG